MTQWFDAKFKNQVVMLLIGAFLGFLPVAYQIHVQAQEQRKQFWLEKRLTALKDFTSALNNNADLLAQYGLLEQAIRDASEESDPLRHFQNVVRMHDDISILDARYVVGLKAQARVVDVLFGVQIPTLDIAELPEDVHPLDFKGKSKAEVRKILRDQERDLAGDVHELKHSIVDYTKTAEHLLDTLGRSLIMGSGTEEGSQMSLESLIGILGILLATAISVYAIGDVQNKATRIIQVGRDLAYLRVKNDLVWEFVDPTDSAYSVQIAKGLHEFGFLAQELDSEQTPETVRATVEKNSLEFADELVKNGKATWKKGLNLEKAREQINIWQAEKNLERAKKMLGET